MIRLIDCEMAPTEISSRLNANYVGEHGEHDYEETLPPWDQIDEISQVKVDAASYNSSGVVSGLGQLDRADLIEKKALAAMFGLHPVSIDRAVSRGELPMPVKILGKRRWTVGAIIDHMNARLKEETENSARDRQRLARYNA